MYKKTENGFAVMSRKTNAKYWYVNSDMTTCTCPKFKFITKGAPCHHIDEVKLGEKAITNRMTPVDIGGYKKWTKEDFLQPMKYEDFMKLYGEAQYNHLVATFEVFYDRRGDMIRRL